MSSIFSKDLENKKRNIKILILGPYRPQNYKQRLTQFRVCLQNHGYETARLVDDFPDVPRYDPDPDIHFTLKSRDKIKSWAKSLVFVFFRNADNQGVSNELTFTCDLVREKIHDSIVLHEQGVNLSTQTKGPLKISRMCSDKFCTDRALCDKAIGFCTKVVYELLWTP